MNTAVVIGLSAVVVAIRDGEAVVLTVRPHDAVTDIASPLSGLPFGPFDPEAHRTFELGLRAFVTHSSLLLRKTNKMHVHISLPFFLSLSFRINHSRLIYSCVVS